MRKSNSFSVVMHKSYGAYEIQQKCCIQYLLNIFAVLVVYLFVDRTVGSLNEDFYMLSDGYSNKDILYKWEIQGNDGMLFVPKTLRMLPQFALASVDLYSETSTYVAGEFIRCRP